MIISLFGGMGHALGIHKPVAQVQGTSIFINVATMPFLVISTHVRFMSEKLENRNKTIPSFNTHLLNPYDVSGTESMVSKKREPHPQKPSPAPPRYGKVKRVTTHVRFLLARIIQCLQGSCFRSAGREERKGGSRTH